MIIPDYREFKHSNELYHYGIPRRSGRYPWGSGKRPYQGDKAAGTYELKKYQSERGYKVKAAVKQISKFIPLISTIVITNDDAKRIRQNYDATTDYVKKDGPIEELSKLKRKTNTTSIEDDIKKCNPGYGKLGTTNNCTNCVTTMEMRRRGYDVQARRAGIGKPTEIYEEIFKGAKVKWPTYEKKENETEREKAQRVYNLVMNELESQGNGARGVIRVGYAKFTNARAGHVMYYEVNDGKANIYDCQKGTPGTVDYVLSFADPDQYAYVRLDNVPVTEKVTELVVSTKGR